MSPSSSPSPSQQQSQTAGLPSPAAAIILFTLALALNISMGLVSVRLGWSDTWLLVLTPILLLVLTALGVAYLRVDARETLLLRWPSLSDLVMAFPLALSLVVLNDQLSTLTQELYPIPEEIQESLRGLLRIESAGDWLFKIMTIGVGAAVSEELLFRGFIQGAFLGGMSRTKAVLWTSFLFMVLHALPLPSFAAAGIVLGLAALGSRSIVVPVIVHFTNNVSSLALVNLGGLDTLGDPVWIPPSILVPAAAIFVISIGYFLRRVPAEASPPGRPVRPLRPKETDEVASLTLPSPSVAEELAGVSSSRRRLGWLVVLLALGLGVSVLTALFVYSVYSANPERVQASIIEVLERGATENLAPEARHREPEIHQAFARLADSNRSGELSAERLREVVLACARVSADASVDDAEVDELLAVLRHANGTTNAPRRL